MTISEKRKRLKKELERVPPDRLDSLGDFIAFLSRHPLADRIEIAEREIKAGKGTPWRKVRRDV